MSHLLVPRSNAKLHMCALFVELNGCVFVWGVDVLGGGRLYVVLLYIILYEHAKEEYLDLGPSYSLLFLP